MQWLILMTELKPLVDVFAEIAEYFMGGNWILIAIAIFFIVTLYLSKFNVSLAAAIPVSIVLIYGLGMLAPNVFHPIFLIIIGLIGGAIVALGILQLSNK